MKLLVYDGDCGLCHWAVGFLIKRLKKESAQLRFISSTSEAGDYLLKKFNFDPKNLDSLVLYENKQVLLRSQAVAEALQECSYLWPIIGKVVKVAQNRQKFMSKDKCAFDADFGRFSLSKIEQLKKIYPDL